MAANTSPIFVRRGDVSSNGSTGMAPTLTTAAADYDGSSANNQCVFTADSTNGGLIRGVRFSAKGSNVATVARIYTNNGSTNTSAANNSLSGQISLPATTASASTATMDVDFIFPGGGLPLNAGFRIFAGLGTTVSAGWVATPILGGVY
jgi:hypothetical protein